MPKDAPEGPGDPLDGRAFLTTQLVGTVDASAPPLDLAGMPAPCLGAWDTIEISAAFEVALGCHKAGALGDAVKAYREVIALDPAHVPARLNLAALFYDGRKYGKALDLYRAVHALDPASAPALSGIAACLCVIGEIDEALALYEQAHAADPQSAAVLSNYGDGLNCAGRHEEAVEKLTAALALEPNHAMAHCNLGTAYGAMGRVEDAIAEYRHAVALAPSFWAARKNLGAALVMIGAFAEGWQEYDWRFAADGPMPRGLTAPVWDHGPVDGELLICLEQGLGDQILQAGLIADLAAHLAAAPDTKIVWECDPRLAPLIARSFPMLRVLAAAPWPGVADAGPGIKAQYPAGSLARLFRPSAESFPARGGHLKADPARVAEMVERLDLEPGQKLVGFSWRSDRKNVNGAKSTDLAAWADILATENTRFVSLQYGADDSGLALPGLDNTNDLEGLAALISLCDAVVTVSNVTAHIAGALGVPCFVLVGPSRAARWYWGASGETTPWYRTAHLIRREYGEAWGAPLAAAAARLKDFLQQENF